MKPTYHEIVQAELQANDIRLCTGCDNGLNHRRGWAFSDERVIHYSKSCATRSTLYGFLHEVGHIVRGHGKACKLRRFQKEQEADDYSRDSFRAYGLPIPRAKAAKVRRYIARRKRTGDRVIAALKHHQEVLACK